MKVIIDVPEGFLRKIRTDDYKGQHEKALADVELLITAFIHGKVVFPLSHICLKDIEKIKNKDIVKMVKGSKEVYLELKESDFRCFAENVVEKQS